MSRFDPEFYRRYRPFYPAELYSGLASELARRSQAEPYSVADIGCGTGHSSASLLRSGLRARITGVDPDPAMLEAARAICPTIGDDARFVRGSGEATGLPAGAFDAVTIGSALHWMDASRTREEVARILRPAGLLLVYEYQFPKAEAHPELNEWIRREFNLRWKAPGQKPRGDFTAVTAGFREDPRFGVLEDRKVSMRLSLGAEQLTGLILSQSRVLHYEAPMSHAEKADFRGRLASEVRGRLAASGDTFDFSLQGCLISTSFR